MAFTPRCGKRELTLQQTVWHRGLSQSGAMTLRLLYRWAVFLLAAGYAVRMVLFGD